MKIEFVDKMDEETYETFVKNHKMGHFLQSYAWGQAQQETRGLIPFYVGMKVEGILVATALLLEKKLPFHKSYFYIPRGFIIDYQNEKFLSLFTDQIKAFCEKKGALFFKIDPDLVYQRTTWDNLVIGPDEETEKLFATLKKLGYRHFGFTKNFETMQPRYTFQIDLSQSLDEIRSHFTKTTNQRIQKAEKLHIKTKIGTKDDIKEFYHLMSLTEHRQDFISHDLSYYEKTYEIYNQTNPMVLFLGIVPVQEIVKDLKREQQEVFDKLSQFPVENLSKSQNNKKKELVRQHEKIEKDLDHYQEIQKKYGDEVVTNAHMIMIYGKKAWVLYAGNHDILTESYANYKTYLSHIEYCKEEGVTIYDQFGSSGDLRKESPYYGLYEFKKKFGGDFVEYFGEFDYILHPFLYFIFVKLVPWYRRLVKHHAKKKAGVKGKS